MLVVCYLVRFEVCGWVNCGGWLLFIGLGLGRLV